MNCIIKFGDAEYELMDVRFQFKTRYKSDVRDMEYVLHGEKAVAIFDQIFRPKEVKSI